MNKKILIIKISINITSLSMDYKPEHQSVPGERLFC